jgi:tetratricopeptide (TPR) repeat protein
LFRGNLNRLERRWDDAITDYQEALRIDEKQYTLMVSLAMAHLGKREFSQARAKLKEASALDPERGPAWIALVECMYLEGDYDGAINVVQELLRRHPEDTQTRYVLGRVYQAAGRHKEAVREFNDVLKVKAGLRRADTLVSRGRSLVAPSQSAGSETTRELDAAVSDFTEAIYPQPRLNRLTLRSARFLVHRARAYLLKRDFLRASLDATAALAIRPSESEAYQIRGEARSRLGDLPGSKEDFSEFKRRGGKVEAGDEMLQLEPFDVVELIPRSLGRVSFHEGRGNDDRSTLNRWLRVRQPRPDAPKPRLVVVATSGGGIAAAYWTIVCLCHIEDLVPLFPYHVRIITGASGGMVGAGFYVASLQKADENRPFERLSDLVRVVGTESLTPVLRTLILKDLPHAFPSQRRRDDRGRALEEAWKANAGDRPESMIAGKFTDLAPGEWEGWRPSLIVSPSLAGVGRPLLISNLELGSLGGGVELFELLPGALDISLATALRLNAAFPWITPDVPLPTYPPLYPLDAGYLDNDGLVLATDWIWKHRRWLLTNTSGVGLIRIRTYRDERRDAPYRRDDEESRPSLMQEILRPLSAYNEAKRELLIEQHNDRLERLRDFFNAEDEDRGGRPQPEFFREFELLADVVDVPLSWSLSSRDRTQIDKAVQTKRNEEKFEKIKEFLEDKGEKPGAGKGG